MEEPDLRRGLTNFDSTAIDMYLAGEIGHRGCMVVSTATVESASDEAIREVLNRTIKRLDGILGERFRKAAEAGELPAA